MLTAIRHERSKDKELSFTQAADVNVHIAQRGCDEWRRRSEGAALHQAALNIDILSHVIHTIVSDYHSVKPTDCYHFEKDDDFVDVEGAPSSEYDKEITETLRSTSPVHRSMAQLVQKALSRRKLCIGYQGLSFSLAWSPLIGPWTTELVLDPQHPEGLLVRCPFNSPVGAL